jgi:hypothetical protein
MFQLYPKERKNAIARDIQGSKYGTDEQEQRDKFLSHERVLVHEKRPNSTL